LALDYFNKRGQAILSELSASLIKLVEMRASQLKSLHQSYISAISGAIDSGNRDLGLLWQRAQLSFSRRQVKEKRYELGIPAFQLNPEIKQWDAAMLRDIPKLSIADFAKKYAVTRTRVIAQRLRLGILPTAPKSRWTHEMDRELMDMKIQEFATKYQMSRHAAYARRKKLLAIPAVN
jgi:hypothetical protein